MSQQTTIENPRSLPEPAVIARNLAEVAQHVSQLMAYYMAKESYESVSLPSSENGMTEAFTAISSRLLADPFKLMELQTELVYDYFSLWQRSALKMMGLSLSPLKSPSATVDRRFKDEDWESNIHFDFIKQFYLITAEHLSNFVSTMEGLDDKTQRKANFLTNQFIDALSPTNFALTNPEVIRETVNSGGQNLIKGFENLLRDMDIENGQLRIRMTDPDAFELGRNIATTPGKVIFQNDLIQLIQYNPTTEQQFKKPLLVVPAFINKYYILDLREKNSYIKWATDQGHTTFVISWVNPDERHANKNFENYMLEGTIAAVDAIQRATGAKQINAVGYCIGGTLLMATLAYMNAIKDKRIASATFFTTMIDFSEPGDLGVFIDEPTVAGLERRMAKRGYFDGADMAGTFSMMRANELVWPFVVNNYLLGKDPMPFDLLYWNSDSTRLPATMHSYYLRNFYMGNKLRECGGIELVGVKIDISKVTTPCYFVSAIEDHIAPWKSTYKGALLPSGKVKFVLAGSGHIAGMVNPPIAKKYGYWTNDALPSEADDYLAGATQTPGSWWPDWQQWIADQVGGKAMVAARQPGEGELKIIEDAPGTYVRYRLDKKQK